MASFRETLRDLVRNIGFRTTPDELKKRGLKQVNIVGLDRIALLIEESVERTLRERAAALDLDRSEIAGATKDEFIRLLKDHQDLEGAKARVAREKAALEAQVAVLRRELADQQSALQSQVDAVQHAVADGAAAAVADAQALDARIRELFKVQGASHLVELRRDVVQVALAAVAAERRKAEAARTVDQQREVDLLERRVRKLSQSLELSERELQRVAGLKDVDLGVASLFRTVQGLGADDRQADRKRDMMAAIFRANLALKGTRPGDDQGAVQDAGRSSPDVTKKTS